MFQIAPCSPIFLFLKMASQCLRNRALVNTDLNLEGIIKEATLLRWHCQKGSLPPDEAGLHQDTWLSMWQRQLGPHVCAWGLPYPKAHPCQEVCSVSLEAEGRGTWVPALHLPCKSLWWDLSRDGILFTLQVSTADLAWDLLSCCLASTLRNLYLSQFLLMLFESLLRNITSPCPERSSQSVS